MMDTVTVSLVVRMTGLLVLTPASGSGDGPMHVLMPQTAYVGEAHVAQVGYRGPQCVALPDGICWRDLDGWSVEIGTAGAALPVRLPYAEADLSRNTGIRVPRALLGPDADPAVLRSRLTLHGGAVTGACALSRWSLAAGGDAVPMADVLEWTITDLPAASAVLRARRIGESGPVESIVLATDGYGTVELYVRHVPRGEAELHDGVPTTYDPRPVRPGEAATHFHAVYDLFAAGPAERRLPVYRGALPGDCRHLWPIGRDAQAQMARREAGRSGRGRFHLASTSGVAAQGTRIYTCMMATAHPD